MNTKKIKLPSGVECIISELLGKHQRLLTQKNGEDVTGNFNEVLVSIIQELGDIKSVALSDVQGMLAPDRKEVLVQARHLTMGKNEPFNFNFEYYDKVIGRKEKLALSYDFIESGDFPVTEVKKLDADGKVVIANYTKFSEIVKEFEIVLPRSKKLVSFTMLDGHGETIVAETKKKNRDSHLPLRARKVKEIVVVDKQGKDKKPTKVNLNLDTLPLKDIAVLRNTIQELEGRVDTEIAFEHPETEEMTYQDALGSLAFFFPSESI
jgi:uncharacterized protein YacL (UPF0231 family)